MCKLAVHIACAISLGDLGFVLLARCKVTENVRYLAIYVALAYLVLLGIRSAKLTSYKVVFHASLAASVAFSAIHQVMGYTWFPGIVKEREFISLENFYITLISIVISTLLLFVGFALLKFVMRFFTQK